MKVIIIHHVEPMWSEGLKSMRVNIQDYLDDIMEHLKESNYDRVILTRFEKMSIDSFREDNDWFWRDYARFMDHELNCCYEVEEYGYGWDRAMFDLDDSDELPVTLRHGEVICEGGDHSEVVVVDTWMQELLESEVHIAGCFDTECIEDLEIALSHIGIDFKRIEALII